MNINERNDKKIEEKIKEEEKRFQNLEKVISTICVAEKIILEKRREAFKVMDNINDENAHIKDIYSLFKNKMIELEKARENKINKLEKTIIPAIKYYPQKIRNLKDPLNKIKTIQKNVSKHQEKLDDAVKQQNQDQANIHEQEIKANENRKKIEGEKMEKEFLEFEAERVEDNKNVILHYIHSELAYHASALQEMSKLYQEISIREPKEKLREFIDKYKLTSMLHFNLEERFNFKQGVTEERKKEILDRENAPIANLEEKKPKCIIFT